MSTETTDLIRSQIGDEDYEALARLIQLHQMLTDGTGLDEDEYEEYENLTEGLKNILPVH